MRSFPTSRRFLLLPVLWLAPWLAVGSTGAAGEASSVRALHPATDLGLPGGVVVHIGCRGWMRSADWLLDERFVVQALDTDPLAVVEAREALRARGVQGRVTAERFDGRHLPCVEGMVNALVAEDLGGIGRAEALRVLAPGGVLVVGGTREVKPRPETIDEWTHYLHGPDNNAVAQDTVVGPPRSFQWQAGPKWPRHHDKMSSISALVSSAGRLFYIFDEGSTASILLPSRWALIARDAFNGKVLWKRGIPTWYTRFKGLKDGPADAPRRLVASGPRVWATLDLDGALSCLDAATGRTLRVYEGTEGTEEILYASGMLFVLVGPHSIGDGGRLVRPVERRRILALDADSGEKRWEVSDVVGALTLAVDDARVVYFDFEQKKVTALDRGSGAPLWESAELPAPARQTSFFGSKLVLHEGVVLFASGEFSGTTKSGGGETRSDTLSALSALTGETLWTAPHPPSGYSSPEDLFVIDGLVWCEDSSNGRSDGTVVARDVRTGEKRHEFPSDRTSYWFHHRCYSGRATSNYLMTSRTGIEFIDFRERSWDLNHWVRGACLYGVMPCNGLVYAPPAPCICYAETYLHSFNALAPARAADGIAARIAATDGSRLQRGPAHDEPLGPEAEAADWPTYRADNARSGATTQALSADPKPSWSLDLGGKLSAVTVAGGMVYLAAVDRHEVLAVDAGTGRVAWRCTVGGRVDSPPTWWRGRVLFGSADGSVYCLRARGGRLVWRFLAAPCDRRILSYEQLESLWPVHGSVLVRDGVAHFVAGRSIFVDGGLRLYRVDARSGEARSVTTLDERNPATGNNVQELVKWLNMPVGRPDILSSDDGRLYMRSQAFDLEGRRLRMAPHVAGAREGQHQGGESTHLFCPTGFLDDTWFHRTYWMYGRTWGSGWCGYYVAGQYAPAGKIMVVGEDRVFVFGRQPRYYRWTTPMEFRLFAAKKEWRVEPPGRPVGPAASTAAGGRAAGRKAAEKDPPPPVRDPANYTWTRQVPILVRAMALTRDTLFIAGPEDVLDESRPAKARQNEDLLRRQEAVWRGEEGAILRAVARRDGTTQSELRIGSPPVFDGMAAAGGRLFLTTADGTLRCFQ